MILIIDNGSNFIKIFEKKLQEKNIKYKIFNHSEQIDFDKLPPVKGVILSGGPGDPFTTDNVTTDFQVLMNLDVPIIGFCLGHEIINIGYGGKVEDLPEDQNKMQKVILDKPEDPIFEGVGKTTYLREKHHRHVSKIPDQFETLGHSDVCPHEITHHKGKTIYSFQSHPEVSGEDGFKIMRNFLKMCGEKI